MATHPSVLAWRIPWTEELGGLQSMRWPRVRFNSATKHNTVQGWFIVFDCSGWSCCARAFAPCGEGAGAGLHIVAVLELLTWLLSEPGL